MEKTFRDYNTDALSFLSGAKERDNLIIINTVNDSNKLPSFIKDRPSRIEEEFYFSFDDEDILTSIVENMIPKKYYNDIEISELVTKLKNYKNKSIDRIRHIIRDIIAISIDLKKTGIQKELIIKDTISSSRPIVAGFNLQDEIEDITDIYIKTKKPESNKEFDWNKDVMEKVFSEVCKN
jgi:hypothetical protein